MTNKTGTAVSFFLIRVSNFWPKGTQLFHNLRPERSKIKGFKAPRVCTHLSTKSTSQTNQTPRPLLPSNTSNPLNSRHVYHSQSESSNSLTRGWTNRERVKREPWCYLNHHFWIDKTLSLPKPTNPWRLCVCVRYHSVWPVVPS